MIDRPGDIVGQTLRFELLIEVVPGAVAAGLIEPLAGLGGAAVDIVERAVQILGTVFDAVVEGAELGLGHAALPQHAGAQPLRVVDAKMEGRPRHRNAVLDQPLAGLDQDVVEKALAAQLDHQPIEDAAAALRPDAVLEPCIGASARKLREAAMADLRSAGQVSSAWSAVGRGLTRKSAAWRSGATMSRPSRAERVDGRLLRPQAWLACRRWKTKFGISQEGSDDRQPCSARSGGAPPDG